jgi:hypothetical protein
LLKRSDFQTKLRVFALMHDINRNTRSFAPGPMEIDHVINPQKLLAGFMSI